MKLLNKKKIGSNFSFFKQSSIEVDFKLCGVNIVYDVYYVLEENKKGNSTYLLRYDNVFFNLKISRKHDEVEKGSLKYMGTNSGGRGQWDMSVKIHPNTPQDQLIARTVRRRKKNKY